MIKTFFKKSVAILFSLCIALSIASLAVSAADNAITVSLSGKSSCDVDVSDYKVTLTLSDSAIGGIQGTVEYDKEIFDFQNVTVKSNIAKINRLTKKNVDITTSKDIVNVNENAGTVDFVVLSDGKTKGLITFNFKIIGNIPKTEGRFFALNNVKVSQSGGAKRVETVGITNLPAPHHSFGKWSVITEPTLFTEGLKSRTCSVCSCSETAKVEKLGADSAELKFAGATRIVLEKKENTQYSIDGINWQSNNIFIGLKANTKYSVYSRAVDTVTNEFSGVSEALAVETVDIDCLVGEVKAGSISQVAKILLHDKKIAWADVNGDAIIDIRDLIRIKKVSAGCYNSYASGDINEDGSVDGNDAQLLSGYLNGNIESIRTYLGDINGDNILDVNDLNLIKN